MKNKILDNIINLSDEDGNEMKFEVLDCLENEKGKYYALCPKFELPDIDSLPDEEDYFIFESKRSSDGYEYLKEVSDDQTLDELSSLFEKRFGEIF